MPIDIKNLEKITEICHNFSVLSQEIVEQYYLQPLDKSHKEELKDGFIERPIHGATCY